MHANLVLEEAVDQTDRLMCINTSPKVRELENSLLKVVQLIPVVGVFVSVAQAGFEHEVGLNDPGEPVTHL